MFVSLASTIVTITGISLAIVAPVLAAGILIVGLVVVWLLLKVIREFLAMLFEGSKIIALATADGVSRLKRKRSTEQSLGDPPT